MVMSAELLREAAALMRERAEATGVDEVEGWYYPETLLEPLRLVAVPAATRPDAEHIASWYPAVALAVADWLDEVADLYSDPSDRIVSEQAMWDAALTVARVYLGRDT
jgi:hypothetical protein